MALISVLVGWFFIVISVIIGGGISLGIGGSLGYLTMTTYYNVQGIPKETRQHETIITVLASLAITPLVGLFIFSRLFSYSPTEAFQEAFGMPMPDRVSILQAKSTILFGSTIWLHFTIAPEDLHQILTSQGYKQTLSGGERYSPSGQETPPSWWKPYTTFGTTLQAYNSINDEWFKNTVYQRIIL